MWRDDLRGICYIALKDMKTYYLKPPAISWGIIFPLAWILAFYLRNPRNFEELVPGLIAMTVLFSTTALEAVVINFELRIGALERLLLAPINLSAVLLGKLLGGVIFGLLMATLVSLGTIISLGLLQVRVLDLAAVLLLSVFVFSALGTLICVSVKEVFEAQTLANLPRFLMVFLCGVFYPISAMPAPLQSIAYLLPLTYTVEGIERAFSGTGAAVSAYHLLVLAIFIVIFTLPAMRLLRRRFE
jgi:ABC-2 type transport system permease protein